MILRCKYDFEIESRVHNVNFKIKFMKSKTEGKKFIFLLSYKLFP